MRLLHYSNEPLTSVHSVEQRPHFKPCGLWVSVEGPDDWKSWCKDQPSFPLGQIEHEVILAPGANILVISTPSELDDFAARYGNPEARTRLESMDWGRVARDYQGLIIAPYIWERRLSEHTFWYYAWDCASGCIWDAAAIFEVKC
jgi:hypothetical protein